MLGGGTASSVPTVQAFTPGTPATVTGAMSRARSDSGGVSAGPAGYVIGGYDGSRLDPEVLATRDGLHFRVAARLPVPVRYDVPLTALSFFIPIPLAALGLYIVHSREKSWARILLGGTVVGAGGAAVRTVLRAGRVSGGARGRDAGQPAAGAGGV